MAPTIQNYSEIDLELVSIRERDFSIRYDNKPLYIQTPLFTVRKFKSEDVLQVKTKDLEWKEFLIKFETRAKDIYYELTGREDFKRTKNLTLQVSDKTQIKSANLIDLELLDLKDVSFRSIISVDKLDDTTTSLKYKIFTVKTTADAIENDEEPNFTVDDLKE